MPTTGQLIRGVEPPFGSLAQLSDGHHTWSADMAASLGGGDLAPDPHDLLDSALAACTLLTLELVIRRKQLPVHALRVHIEHAETPASGERRNHYAISRRIEIDGDLTAEERERLLAVANKCPVHRTLSGEIAITTTLA
jgi:putative redox protein